MYSHFGLSDTVGIVNYLYTNVFLIVDASANCNCWINA